MATSIERFRLPGAEGQTVRGYVHVPEATVRAPAVLLAHGFKGFADYGFLPLTTERLAEAGLAVVRFSFSHCGIEEDPNRFTRPDLFEADTFAHQVADVLALLRALQDGRLPHADRLDASRVGMVGHSRGGVTAILATGATSALRAVVTLASPDRTLHDETTRNTLRALGRMESPSSRTGDMLYIGRALIDDIDTAGEKYDLFRRLEQYPGAYLAVHCTCDATVPSEMASRLAAAHRHGPTELLLIDGGSHTFGFQHGQRDSTPQLDRMTERVAAFLREHLA